MRSFFFWGPGGSGALGPCAEKGLVDVSFWSFPLSVPVLEGFYLGAIMYSHELAW